MNDEQSQYALIAKDWPELCKESEQVEAFALNDPRTACFYARRTIELMVEWIINTTQRFVAHMSRISLR